MLWKEKKTEKDKNQQLPKVIASRLLRELQASCGLIHSICPSLLTSPPAGSGKGMLPSDGRASGHERKGNHSSGAEERRCKNKKSKKRHEEGGKRKTGKTSSGFEKALKGILKSCLFKPIYWKIVSSVGSWLVSSVGTCLRTHTYSYFHTYKLTTADKNCYLVVMEKNM